LTQLVLGVDRDSSELTNLFDESNIAVKRAIKLAIDGAHRHHRPIGLCGQAPSGKHIVTRRQFSAPAITDLFHPLLLLLDNPQFANFLVGEGIDSISVTPDSVIAVLRVVAEAEAMKAKVPK
jgi:pyruvate,water dikinase